MSRKLPDANCLNKDWDKEGKEVREDTEMKTKEGVGSVTITKFKIEEDVE